jgi:hypothetical protein
MQWLSFLVVRQSRFDAHWAGGAESRQAEPVEDAPAWTPERAAAWRSWIGRNDGRTGEPPFDLQASGTPVRPRGAPRANPSGAEATS